MTVANDRQSTAPRRRLSRAAEIGALTGLVLGLLVGVPVSYFLQPGLLRVFIPLTQYIGELPELLSKIRGGPSVDQSTIEIARTAAISIAACGAAGCVIGRIIGARRARLARPPTETPRV